MTSDPRAIGEAAAEYQRRADEVRAKAGGRKLTADQQDQITADETQAAILGEFYASALEREKRELRDIVKQGHILGEGIASGDPEVRDFLAYVKSGDPSTIRNTALSTTDANGGFIVPEPLHASLVEKVRLVDPIYAAATHLDLSPGDSSIELPYKSGHGQAAWAAEAASRSEQTEPTFTNATLVCYDVYSDQRATQTVVDSIPNFESMMLGWLYQDVYELLGTALAVGTGSTQAVGVFTAASGYTAQFSGAATTLLNTSPAKLLFSLPSKYQANAAWYCTSATLAILAGFALPSNANIALVDQSGDVPRMYGKEVRITGAAPEVGAGNYALGYGDLAQGYVIGTHRRPGVLVDPYTAVPKVRYYALARLGGCPWDVQAFQIMRMATV